MICSRGSAEKASSSQTKFMMQTPVESLKTTSAAWPLNSPRRGALRLMRGPAAGHKILANGECRLNAHLDTADHLGQPHARSPPSLPLRLLGQKRNVNEAAADAGSPLEEAHQ